MNQGRSEKKKARKPKKKSKTFGAKFFYGGKEVSVFPKD